MKEFYCDSIGEYFCNIWDQLTLYMSLVNDECTWAVSSKGMPILLFCRYANTPLLVIADMSIFSYVKWQICGQYRQWINEVSIQKTMNICVNSWEGVLWWLFVRPNPCKLCHHNHNWQTRWSLWSLCGTSQRPTLPSLVTLPWFAAIWWHKQSSEDTLIRVYTYSEVFIALVCIPEPFIAIKLWAKNTHLPPEWDIALVLVLARVCSNDECICLVHSHQREILWANKNTKWQAKMMPVDVRFIFSLQGSGSLLQWEI